MRTGWDPRHKKEKVHGAVEPEEAIRRPCDVLRGKGLESTGTVFPYRNGKELP
jgi:hypothetical protein